MKNSSPPDDIWALGAMFFEMLTLKKAFGNQKDIRSGKYDRKALKELG